MLKKFYGVDIAVRRADDLDRKMIQWVENEMKKGHTPQVLDVGCGRGGQSLRLASAGACVVGVDIMNFSDEFDFLQKEFDLSQRHLQFYQGSLTDVHRICSDKEIDMCAMQRVIHYVPYNEALCALQYLCALPVQKLCISVTGLESEIGRSYSDKDKEVQERFCRLNEEDQNIFGITQPVCLYTPEEFIILLQESGYNIEECWVSAFGNVKAICSLDKVV